VSQFRLPARDGSSLARALSPFAAGLLLAGASAAQVTFGSREVISSQFVKANSAVGVDIDGDGDRDVLACWVEDNTVTWHENVGGDASSWISHTVTINIIGSRYANAGDVDGDGDIDVLTASCLDDEIAWYENANGDGLTWVEHSITVNANCAQYVDSEDVDEDGDLDVLSMSYLDSKVAWHENLLGDGTMWTEHVVSTDGNGGREVSHADMDGDGDPDILGAWSEAMKVAWHDNTAGDGSAWTQNTITTMANGADSVIAADLDGDGDLDAAGASFIDGKVSWYENVLGDATMWIKHDVDPSATLADSVAAGDVDQDGDLDLLAAVFGDDVTAWYENVGGDGSTWTKWIVTSSADGARRVRLSDVDMDGDIDVLGASYEGGQVMLYRNLTEHPEAIAFATAATVDGAADGARAVTVVDLDRDGDLDLASASFDSSMVAWSENTAGDASAWFTTQVTNAWSGVQAIAAGDVDDDGDPDLLSAAGTAGAVLWHENTLGDGTAWMDRPVSLALLDPRSVRVADLDRDGELDVLTASAGDGTIAWHENLAGDGSMWTPRAISSGATAPSAAVAADIDADGDPDVVGALTGLSEIAWYQNLAGTGLTWKKKVIATGVDAVDVVVVDLDADGDLDVAAALGADDTVAWYENAGGGGGGAGAWTAHVVGTGIVGASSVLPDDVDRDGDVDLVVASEGDDTVAWYENDGGAGLAWKRHVVTVEADGAADALVADLDRDGFPDIAMAARNGDLVSWADGQASPAASLAILPCPDNPPGSLVDLGGDPVIGGTFTLGVDNPLGTFPVGSLPAIAVGAFPASSTACGIPLPGLGMDATPGQLQISIVGPSLLGIVVGPAWLGVGQPSPISVPIPAEPTLVLKTIYVQGAMFDPVLGKIGLAETAEIVIGP